MYFNDILLSLGDKDTIIKRIFSTKHNLHDLE
jgi:hypothetical protein